jgi:hypothetical protein
MVEVALVTVTDPMLSYTPRAARVKELDAADAGDEPVLLDAVTVKV